MNIKFTPDEYELLCTAVASQKNSARKEGNEFLKSKYGSLLAKLEKSAQFPVL